MLHLFYQLLLNAPFARLVTIVPKLELSSQLVSATPAISVQQDKLHPSHHHIFVQQVDIVRLVQVKQHLADLDTTIQQRA